MFHADVTHPLWSARLVDKEEDVVVAAHLAFLQAGSQVILTSTSVNYYIPLHMVSYTLNRYQAAYETFRRSGYKDSDAESLMHKSVELAVKARDIHESELETPSSSEEKAKIALALGPYGATLETAAEFTGIYPAPYGPAAFKHSSSSEPRHGSVPQSEQESYADALAAFHFARLLVYASAAHVWDAIDLIAFETVPLVTEAKAIRIAVARLEDWFRETSTGGNQAQTRSEMKPWYISFVFPGPHGEFSQDSPVAKFSKESSDTVGVCTASDRRRPYTAYEVAQATFSLGGIAQCKLATPNAIGVNCTQSHLVPPIVEEFASAINKLTAEHFQGILPWLALYPNGGLNYDPVGRIWLPSNPPNLHDKANASWGKTWAKGLAEMVRILNTNQSPSCASIFGGLLVGGCCKTGPDEIRALKEELLCP